MRQGEIDMDSIFGFLPGMPDNIEILGWAVGIVYLVMGLLHVSKKVIFYENWNDATGSSMWVVFIIAGWLVMMFMNQDNPEPVDYSRWSFSTWMVAGVTCVISLYSLALNFTRAISNNGILYGCVIAIFRILASVAVVCVSVLVVVALSAAKKRRR